MDPHLDGFNAWLRVDLTPSSQKGLLDMFWNPKWSTAEFFAPFNAPVACFPFIYPSRKDRAVSYGSVGNYRTFYLAVGLGWPKGKG